MTFSQPRSPHLRHAVYVLFDDTLHLTFDRDLATGISTARLCEARVQIGANLVRCIQNADMTVTSRIAVVPMARGFAEPPGPMWCSYDASIPTLTGADGTPVKPWDYFKLGL